MIELNFYEEEKLAWMVVVYRAGRFSGTLTPTEEGPLRWFDANAIPFKLMWEDDEFWVPQAMQGKRLEGHFYFGKGLNGLVRKEIKEAKF